MNQRILHSLRANLKNVLEFAFDSSKLWVGLKGCLSRGVSSLVVKHRRCTGGRYQKLYDEISNKSHNNKKNTKVGKCTCSAYREVAALKRGFLNIRRQSQPNLCRVIVSHRAHLLPFILRSLYYFKTLKPVVVLYIFLRPIDRALFLKIGCVLEVFHSLNTFFNFCHAYFVQSFKSSFFWNRHLSSFAKKKNQLWFWNLFFMD